MESNTCHRELPNQDLEWEVLLKDVYSLKSLKHYSVRGDPWELPGHVKDAEVSEVLCKFRVGNAGLGNRAPLGGMPKPSKFCILCSEANTKHPLNEYHISFVCKKLRMTQLRLGLLAYKSRRKNELVLHGYLGGDGCTNVALLDRGSVLIQLLDAYFQQLRNFGLSRYAYTMVVGCDYFSVSGN